MMDGNGLREHFISFDAEYREGAVFVAEQDIACIEVTRATLTITALGVFAAYIDDEKIGDELLAPGYTYYPRDLHYRTYDVTDMVKSGSVLKVYLGQGWYCGRFTFENKTRIYGDMPAVAWVLNITFPGGERSFCSDDEGVRSIRSPYSYAGLYDGEIYGNVPEDDSLPRIVKYSGSLPDVIEYTDMCIRMREEMPVVSWEKRGDVTILDFGQNFAGIAEIHPEFMDGDIIRLRHGEILNPDGTLYTANLRKAKQEIVYHRNGSAGPYRPEFTYMGFRYIEVSGSGYRDGLIRAYAVYSDMERTGDFTCDNEFADRLYRNQVWGQKSNYVEVPTDCPQRDERMGYTGDGQVFAETGAFNYDTRKFWNKFLKDIRYSQADNSSGYVMPTVPAQPGSNRAGFMSMLGWGNCICIVPDMLYRQFGDIAVIRENYESMKAFAECEISKTGGLLGKKDLWIAPSLGDWLALGKDVKYMALHNGPVSNAFLVNDMKIMSRAAALLGKTEDEKRYAEQLEKSRAAYIKAFIKRDGCMKDDYQGAYVMALAYVLENGELRDRVFAKLKERLLSEGMQTGFFATEHILPLLCDGGEEKLAFDLMLSEKCPGWMYQIKRGATTTWERWDAIREDGTVNETKMSSDNMVSFNHYAFGSVGKFYYRYILGINAGEPGFARAVIKPHTDSRVGSFKGHYDSVSGRISVGYDQESGMLSVESPVPFRLKYRGTEKEYCPGSYRIKT
jgi:alpha-L-rhamnosidase